MRNVSTPWEQYMVKQDSEIPFVLRELAKGMYGYICISNYVGGNAKFL